MESIDLSSITKGLEIILFAIVEFGLLMALVMTGYMLVYKFIRMPKWIFNVSFRVVTYGAFAFLLFNNYIPSVKLAVSLQ